MTFVRLNKALINTLGALEASAHKESGLLECISKFLMFPGADFFMSFPDSVYKIGRGLVFNTN